MDATQLFEDLRDQLVDVHEQTGAGDRQFARAVENILRRQDIVDPFRGDEAFRDPLYRLAWWMFVRAPALDMRHFVFSSMALDVVQSGTRSLDETLEDLEELEENRSLDDPAPSPIEVDDDVRAVQGAFRTGASRVDEIMELGADELQPLITGVVGELLERKEFFRELSQTIAEDLMEEFGDLADSGAFDEAMHTPLGDDSEHAHSHDYEELDRAEEYVERANERYEHGDVDGAVDDYTEALEMAGDDSDIYRQRGVARAAMNDIDEAIEDWTTALELDSENVSALVDRALARLETGQAEEALEDYDRAAELDERAEIFANRGVARFQTGDFEGAKEDLDHALELDEESVPAYLNRAMIRQATGDLVGAFKDYGAAIEIDSNCAQAYASRGYLRLEQGELEAAIDDFESVTEIHPYDASNYYNLGNAYAEKGDWDRAIAQYDRAIDLDPEDPQAYSNRGSAKIQRQNFQGAIDDWNEAIELDPYNPIPYVKRAGVWNMLDQEDEAVEDLEQALEVAPEDWELLPRVEQMLEQLQ